jgi:16S rRNA (uracil1498-N3)-methyltransferase
MDRIPIKEYEDGVIRDAEAVRHLRKVLRLRPGASFLAYDGMHELRLRLESYEEGAAQASELARRTLSPAADLTIAQCLIKGPRWDTFVEKATELGVARILPVVSERTVARVSESQVEKRLARWHRIARAAAAQSAGRTPVILDPMPLAAALDRLGAAAHKFIVCFAPDAAPLAQAAPPGARMAHTALLLGPEGDFTEQEIVAARGAGFLPVHLGPRILRSETAALAATVLALHALGALDAGMPDL